MKRKIIAALLVLVLSLGMAVCAQAAGNVTFVKDEFGNLSRLELMKLNALAAKIYGERGVGIFFVYTTAEELTEYNISSVVGGVKDYFIMMENEEHWYATAGGKGLMIDEDAEEALRDVYDAEDTYVGGVEAFLNAAAEYFTTAAVIPQSTVVPTNVPTTVPTNAPTNVPTNIPTTAPTTVPTNIPTTVPNVDTAQEYLLFDEADLLTNAEEAALSRKLSDISHEFGAQIIVATVNYTDGRSVDSYVEYVYDSMDFGYGANRDGVLLLVCMNPRQYRILSNGYAGEAIGSSEIEAIGEALVSDLSDGSYADAFDIFADGCGYYLNGYINGFPFDFNHNLLVALGIGIAAGLIVSLGLKSQLKSVRKQNQAAAYIKQGSMNVTVRRDTFLYRNVTRTKKESSNGSSGSGSSRSVGGGSF